MNYLPELEGGYPWTINLIRKEDSYELFTGVGRRVSMNYLPDKEGGYPWIIYRSWKEGIHELLTG